MGAHGDEENLEDNDTTKNNPNVGLNDAATQRLDGGDDFPSGGHSKDDGDNDFLYLTSTMPFDETFLLEDAFETQLVNLAGETQMMDFGETQVLDDLGCMEHMPTEFFNDRSAEAAAVSDSEGTNVTEVLCDTQEVSKHEVDGSGSVGLENEVNSYQQKEGDNVAGVSSPTFKSEEGNSGSMSRGFTSIRIASIRASGLAARAKGAIGNWSSHSNDKSTLEQQTSEQAGSLLFGDVSNPGMKSNEHCSPEDGEDRRENRNKNSCKAGNTAARKLFMEDEIGEEGQSVSDTNQVDDNLDMPENCLAGLTYANSQEPGELSQANALEVVDRFLEQNILEYGPEFDSRIHIAEKPEVVSGAKGSRDLAKSSIAKSTARKSGIYDWDDTREDEGGGEFLLKKKELLFDNGDLKQRSMTEPVKQKRSNLRKIKSDGKKLGGPINSDSGLMLRKLRGKGRSIYQGKEACHKNLSKDLDEQINVASGPKSPDIDRIKDIPTLENVGPDTQIAAEAMEALCFEMNLPESNGNGPDGGACNTSKVTKKNQSIKRAAHLDKSLNFKTQYTNSVRVTRQAKQTNRAFPNDSSLKQSKDSRKRQDEELCVPEQRNLAELNQDVSSYGKECRSTPPRKVDDQKRGKAGKRSSNHEITPSHVTEPTSQRAQNKHGLQEKLAFSVPVALRTRNHAKLNLSKDAENSLNASKEMNDVIGAPILKKRRTGAKGKSVEIVTIDQLRKLRSAVGKQSNVKSVSTSGALDFDALQHVKGKRTREEKLAARQEADRYCDVNLKRTRSVAARDVGGNHENHSSRCNTLSSIGLQSESSRPSAAYRNSVHVNGEPILSAASKSIKSKKFDKKHDEETLKPAEGVEAIGRPESSPRDRCGTSFPTCTTPSTLVTPIKATSPICMGDEYHKQSCRKNLSKSSLVKEINSLISGSPEPFGGTKEARKRREIADIRVLFSQHLDVDVTKQQKKILARLGASAASTISEATHFVADEFVRTRNMLEAIAFGKPVVTHLWLESCGQAGCLLDEKSYILRDMKKEKEFGFCMPVSLSRACQHPLLQGQKVWITPNTKPGKDILANLVKAVHGLAVERLGRSVLKDEKLPDDLLILSCEEDYDVCVPFLERGGAVYSSELLLNGIVKQKLEYERHRMFADHVKRTRSTIWVRKKDQYLPVAKVK